MKIALHGYGKMGRTIERVATEAGHEVVCILDVDRNDPLSGAEVLIEAGIVDPLIPLPQAERLASLLEGYGAAVTFQKQPTDHRLTSADLNVAQTWIARQSVTSDIQ